MSMALRILLIVAAAITAVFLLRSVKRSRMRIEDTIFWILLTIIILIMAFFPGIVSALSNMFGFMAPVNFVFLFFIFILLLKCYSLSRHSSELEVKVKELTQKIALDNLDHYERRNAENPDQDMKMPGE